MKKGKMMLVMVIVLVSVLTLGIVGCEVEEDPDVDPEPVDVEGEFDQIIGIDPGAGIMSSTEEAIDVYDLELDLLEGSDAAMTAELSTAIEQEEWIVVTGWTPHWKFAEWDLKFLEDPELVYGEEEYIANIGRPGLADDMPEVHEFLENFQWGDEEIGEVMEMNADVEDFLGNAHTWIEQNEDLVDEWTPEGFGEGVDGDEVYISMVEWDCATASTYVAAAVLENAGYEVDVTPVDAGVMWSSTYAGDADFFVCAWLPGTHEDYYDEYGDEIDEIATHYEGARIGLVVPEYVGIDSITEINDHIAQ